MSEPGNHDSTFDFADIRIVDLELARTTWSRVHDSLRVMFLRLDRAPPDNEWIRLFFEERQSRIVALRRGLWVEDGYISFDTAPHEVETVHLPDIRRSIDYANRGYREVVARRRSEREAAAREQRDERADLVALQARVRLTLADEVRVSQTSTEIPVSVRLIPADDKLSTVQHDVATPAENSSESLEQVLEARRQALRVYYRAALSAAIPDKDQAGVTSVGSNPPTTGAA